MSQRALVLILGSAFALSTAQLHATPVDVDGDGIVGPHEAIDLSSHWKGPALPGDGTQPWQTNGTTIFYNAGSVGIGSATPGTKFQVTDGRIRIRESATVERWDLFYDPPTQSFYLQENAAFNHLVFTKGPNSRLAIGANAPTGGTKLHVVANPPAQGFVSHAIYAQSLESTAIRAEGDLGIFAVGVDPNGTGIIASGDTAAVFDGPVIANNVVIGKKSTTQFDHPLDPDNKDLLYSSVVSPEMKNVYDGTIATDSTGYAEVALPSYFEAINKEFRYQLTVIDESDSDELVWAKVVRKVQDNRFTIRTSHPNLEVSWQVTGVRNDAWAKANPNVVEQEKSKDPGRKYLNPEGKVAGDRYLPSKEISAASGVISK